MDKQVTIHVDSQTSTDSTVSVGLHYDVSSGHATESTLQIVFADAAKVADQRKRLQPIGKKENIR